MAEGKKRSGVFRFFYIVLSIITFPIFALLYILKHPLWVLFLLCLIAGGAAYYPMSKGVKLEEVLTWYQDKYEALKFEAVTKAVESGDTGLIPDAIIKEVTETKQKMEEEAAEAARPKSENYNAKLDRDKEADQIKVDFKKRKGGFKKANEPEEVNKPKETNEPEVASEQVAAPGEPDVAAEKAVEAAGELDVEAEKAVEAAGELDAEAEKAVEAAGEPDAGDMSEAATVSDSVATQQKGEAEAANEQIKPEDGASGGLAGLLAGRKSTAAEDEKNVLPENGNGESATEQAATSVEADQSEGTDGQESVVENVAVGGEAAESVAEEPALVLE